MPDFKETIYSKKLIKSTTLPLIDALAINFPIMYLKMDNLNLNAY